MSGKITEKSARALARLLNSGNNFTVGAKGYRDSSFSRVRLAQAPSGGIPARTGITPGSATCTQVIIAPEPGTGFLAGDLVKTSHTFTVLNWDFVIHGADGDRIVQVSNHSNDSFLIGASCTNEEDPANIVLYEPA
jgi:hypothetical protein